MTARLLVTILFFNLTLSFGHNGTSNGLTPKDREEKVSISEISNGSLSISWADSSIISIEIITDNGLFMPEIPVDGAQSLYLTYLTDGIYTIKFKTTDETIFHKSIEVQR